MLFNNVALYLLNNATLYLLGSWVIYLKYSFVAKRPIRFFHWTQKKLFSFTELSAPLTIICMP